MVCMMWVVAGLLAAPGVEIPQSAAGQPSLGNQRIKILRAQADAALAKGQWRAALDRYQVVAAVMPSDGTVQRDLGRAAFAAGDHQTAVIALQRAHTMGIHARDPELHYLRGEALFALGHHARGVAEHRLLEQEAGSPPHDRMTTLWLARASARRGDLARADALYAPLWPRDARKVDEEVAFSHAEAFTLNRDWGGAQRVLHRILLAQPRHLRALLMLAWVLEAQGDVAAEVTVRTQASEVAATAENLRDLGRALERAGNPRAALDRYRLARDRSRGSPDPLVQSSIKRLEFRYTPEASVAMMARGDPSSKELRWQGGAAIPLGSHHLFSVLAWHEYSWGGWQWSQARRTGMQGVLALGLPWGGSLKLGATLRHADTGRMGSGIPLLNARGPQLGGLAAWESSLGPFVHVDVRGELNHAWQDAPLTVREGGNSSGMLSHVYVFPLRTRRVLFDVGGQARLLTLAPRELRTHVPMAGTLLLFAGTDLVVWQDATRALHGNVLDESMLQPNPMADSVVLTYRHYELFTRSDKAFQRRINLEERASPDVVSLYLRKTLWSSMGTEARASIGYDMRRKQFIYSGGLSGSLTLLPAFHLTASYDLGTETTPGFTGQLHTGWLTFHVDL